MYFYLLVKEREKEKEKKVVDKYDLMLNRFYKVFVYK